MPTCGSLTATASCRRLAGMSRSGLVPWSRSAACSVWTWATCAPCGSSSGKNLLHVCERVLVSVPACTCMYACICTRVGVHVATCISSLVCSRGLMLAVSSLLHCRQCVPPETAQRGITRTLFVLGSGQPSESPACRCCCWRCRLLGFRAALVVCMLTLPWPSRWRGLPFLSLLRCVLSCSSPGQHPSKTPVRIPDLHSSLS